MGQAELQGLGSLASAWWLLVAVGACLPVSLAVFWRVGRWWNSADPVPLPLDRAWPAVRWPVWFGLGLFVAMQLLMTSVMLAYHAAAKAGLLPWEPLDVPDMFSPGLFLSQIVPPLAGLAMLRALGPGTAATACARAGRVGSGLWHGVVAFAAILPLCVATLLASITVLTLLRAPVAPHPLLEVVQHAPEPWLLAVAMVQGAVLAPLAEEFLYRGVLMTTLLKQVGIIGALVISSAVFALVHLPSEPQGVPPLFLLGMALGYVTYRTRSLVAAVVAHALFNALMLAGTFAAG